MARERDEEPFEEETPEQFATQPDRPFMRHGSSSAEDETDAEDDDREQPRHQPDSEAGDAHTA